MRESSLAVLGNTIFRKIWNQNHYQLLQNDLILKITMQKNYFKSRFQISWFHILANTAA